MKLDAGDGHTLWQRLIDGPAHLDDRGWFLRVSPGGDPVVTGFTPTSSTEASFYVARLRSSDGGTVWARTLPGAIMNPDDRSGWLAVLDGGDVVLCNKTWTSSTSYDVILHRFGAAGGADVWHVQHNSGGTAADEPRAMIRDASGLHLYVAGIGAGNFQALKFRASDGGLDWSGSYDGPPGWYDAASCVLEGPNGEIILSGYSSGNPTGWDAAAVAFDPANGGQLWVERFDAGYNETDEAPVMARNDLGDLFVCGYAYTPYTYSDMLTLHYLLEPAAGVIESPPPFALRSGPNPFTGALRLELNLPEEAAVRVSVLDASGRRVALLHEGALEQGAHGIEWRPAEAGVRAGTYWLQARVGDETRTVRVVRIR